MKKLHVFGLLQDLVVRLCFVLGNLTAKNEQARLRLFEENEGLDTLLAVLKTYDELDAQVINHISVSILFKGYHFLFLLAKTFTSVLIFMNKGVLVDLVCHHKCSVILCDSDFKVITVLMLKNCLWRLIYGDEKIRNAT